MSSSYRTKFRSIEIVTGPAFWPSAGWAALALFVQTIAAPQLAIRHAVPSFVTIAIVLYALRAGSGRGALLGLLAGTLTDAVAGTPGAWTIACASIGFAAGGLTRSFFSDGIVPPSLFVGAAVLVRDGIFWTAMSTQDYPRGYGTVHLHASLWQALITAACAFVYLAARSRFTEDATRIERFA